ncbi:MAG: hypothetical protein HW421_3970 [Ignavibacteria bacterium]|nr:hypothetical protein [Ignavibacteria bacterium]
MLKFFIIIILILLLTICNILNAKIIINEFNPYPEGDEPEWLELFNTLTNKASLTECMLCDASGCRKIPYLEIPGNGYLIISVDTTALRKARKIPAEALILECKLPALNNTTDKIILRKSDSSKIDSLFYDLKWGIRGISFERRDWAQPANKPGNLLPSISPDSATAGYQNSVAIKDYDLQLKLLANDSILVSNTGRNSVFKFDFNIYFDRNNDGYLNNEELIENELIDSLNPEEEKSKKIDFTKVMSITSKRGYSNISAVVHSEKDQNSKNDTLRVPFYLSYNKSTIIINEFMFDTDSMMCDFVELFNTSSDSISLFHFFIEDNSSVKSQINNPDIWIAPLSYVVIASDSVIFQYFPELTGNPDVTICPEKLNLNYNGDRISLIETNGAIQDELEYTSSWRSLLKQKNISLERINPHLNSNEISSWAACKNGRGATPLFENSAIVIIDTALKLSAEPNPFSPFGNIGKNCIITCESTFSKANFNVVIYDAGGVLMRHLANRKFTSSPAYFVWDGRNDDGFILPIGPYIAVIEATDADSGSVKVSKIVLVIGK